MAPQIKAVETVEEFVEVFGENDYEEADKSGPLGPMPARLAERLAEWRSDPDTPADAKITLGRDWEGCVFGLVEGDPRFDVLAFGENGSVGVGGINLPRMFNTFAELLGREVEIRRERAQAVFTLRVARDALNEGDEFDASIYNSGGGIEVVFVPFTDAGRGGPFAMVTIEGPDGDSDAFMVGAYRDYEDAGQIAYADTPDALVEAVTAIRKELV